MGAGVRVDGATSIDWVCLFKSALVLEATGTLEPRKIEVSFGELHEVRVNKTRIISINDMEFLNEKIQG